MVRNNRSRKHYHANCHQYISYVTPPFHSILYGCRGAKIGFIFILHSFLFYKIKVLEFFCNLVA